MLSYSYLLLLGVSLESDNRGVNILGIGAITLLRQSFPNRNFAILQMSSKERVSKKTICVNDQPVEVTTHYFSKCTCLWTIAVLWLRKLPMLRPSTKLARLILGAEKICDLNGGDSFSDIYGCKRIARHFLDSYMVLLSGKSLTFLPQTIGPFNTFFGKTLGKYILRRLERVYLRDGHGAALLKEIDKPFDIALDVSVHMEPKKIDYEIKENSIGINVNGLLFYMAYGTAVRGFEEYRNILHSLLDELAGGRYDVILVPHTYNVDRPNREDDLLAIRQLCKERRDKTVKYIDRDYDAQALKYIIGQTYFFVGSRLHSCLASLSQLNPTVGLAYSHKFAGTFKMFGQEDCAVDIRGVSRPQIGDIVAKVIDKIRSRDKIKRELVAVDPTKVRSRFE